MHPVRRPHGLSLLLVAIACMSPVGCNSGQGTLSGVVRLDGKPLTGGSVVLYCQGREIVRGIIAEDGSYSVTHIPPGKAMVTVQSHARVPEGMQLKQKLPPTDAEGPLAPTKGSYYKDRKIVIPSRYATPEESGLAVPIRPGVQMFEIELQS